MKTVVICRYAPHEGPGYFATYLSQRNIRWHVAKLDEGDALPDVNCITGLAMMGGPMSVNDDLPWIGPMLSLIRSSITNDVPVIGHCLGGQLLAKALGGRVTCNRVKEIGWARVDVLQDPLAAQWGPADAFTGYHWHGETFSIPEGATRIWSSTHCENQAFVLGKHVAMQCHVEMTQDMIELWCRTGAQEIEDSLASPAVQSPSAMRENMGSRLHALRAVAGRVYARWVAGLKQG